METPRKGERKLVNLKKKNSPKRKWYILPKNTFVEDMREFAHFSPWGRRPSPHLQTSVHSSPSPQPVPAPHSVLVCRGLTVEPVRQEPRPERLEFLLRAEYNLESHAVWGTCGSFIQPSPVNSFRLFIFIIPYQALYIKCSSRLCVVFITILFIFTRCILNVFKR